MDKILFVDTATPELNIALFNNSKIYISDNFDTKEKIHSKEIYNQTNKILSKNNLLPSDISYISVNKGFGSYTGLRIGLSYIKGFAYGTEAKIIGCKSLDILKEILEKSHLTEYIIAVRIKKMSFLVSYFKNNERLLNEKLIDGKLECYNFFEKNKNIPFCCREDISDIENINNINIKRKEFINSFFNQTIKKIKNNIFENIHTLDALYVNELNYY